eukprot:Nk52_evm22s358 gene=Nk52_evmTU22s358
MFEKNKTEEKLISLKKEEGKKEKEEGKKYKGKKRTEKKGFPALNVQAICDNRRRFLSISIRAGSVPDCSVFSRSKLGRYTYEQIPRGKHFVGDAGYSLRDFMITPYSYGKKDDYTFFVLDKFERNYNYVHSVTRMVIEMAFGILKMRWQVLKYELPFVDAVDAPRKQQKNSRLIVACCVLHNMCIETQDYRYFEMHPFTEIWKKKELTTTMTLSKNPSMGMKIAHNCLIPKMKATLTLEHANENTLKICYLR